MNANRIPWARIEAVLGDLAGRPFVRGARGPDAFDCWGVVIEARRRLGLPVPPDFASAALTREDMLALFATQRPAAWRRAPELVAGGIVLARDAGHAGVHVAGRILHAAAKAGVVTWSLGQWAAVYGAIECWTHLEAAP